MSLQGGCYSASPSRRFKAVLVGARWDPSGTTAQSGHGGIRREPPHSRDGFSAGSLRKRDSRFAFVFSYFCFCLFVFVLFCFLIFLVLFCCFFVFLLFFVFFHGFLALVPSAAPTRPLRAPVPSRAHSASPQCFFYRRTRYVHISPMGVGWRRVRFVGVRWGPPGTTAQSGRILRREFPQR